MFQGLVWQYHWPTKEKPYNFFFFFFLSIESWPVDRQATMLEFPINGSATVSSYIFFSTFVECFHLETIRSLSFLFSFIFRMNFLFFFSFCITYSLQQYLHLRNIENRSACRFSNYTRNFWNYFTVWKINDAIRLLEYLSIGSWIILILLIFKKYLVNWIKWKYINKYLPDDSSLA